MATGGREQVLLSFLHFNGALSPVISGAILYSMGRISVFVSMCVSVSHSLYVHLSFYFYLALSLCNYCSGACLYLTDTT